MAIPVPAILVWKKPSCSRTADAMSFWVVAVIFSPARTGVEEAFVGDGLPLFRGIDLMQKDNGRRWVPDRFRYCREFRSRKAFAGGEFSC